MPVSAIALQPLLHANAAPPTLTLSILKAQYVSEVNGTYELTVREKGILIHGARVKGGIIAAEDELATLGGTCVLAHPERKRLLGNKPLADHVVPHGGDVINRDGVKSKAKNAVKLASLRSKAQSS